MRANPSDRGLDELRAKQGRRPASSDGLGRQRSGAGAVRAQAPPPDANVAAELRQETDQANQTEQQVVSQASGAGKRKLPRRRPESHWARASTPWP